MASEKKPSNFKIGPMWIYGILILIFILLNVFGGSSFQEVGKLTTSKFNEYLEKGQVEKVIIFNKNISRFFKKEWKFVPMKRLKFRIVSIFIISENQSIC